MSPAVVIETNVCVVANNGHPEASLACVGECIGKLRQAQQSVILIDDNGSILREYRTYLSHSGQPGVGDAFFKWLWDKQGDATHCLQIQITPSGERGFDEFPDDPELSRFDPSDRKFVAVAIASALSPDVLNASDTDWWPVRKALLRNGVRIQFLCPELMTKKRT